jgi:hypothetical protein
LQYEFAASNKRSEFLGRHQLELDTDLGRLPV